MKKNKLVKMKKFTKVRRCENCGHLVPQEARFCPYCSYELGTVANYSQGSFPWKYFGVVLGVVAVVGGLALVPWDKLFNNKPVVHETTVIEKVQELPAEQEVAEETAPPLPPAYEKPVYDDEAYVEEVSMPAGEFSLSGVLNGDDVQFVLTPTGSNTVRGQFYNYTINVSFAVSGVYTGSGLNLHSTNHGHWHFVASNAGGVMRGFASNGSVQYDMEVQ